MHDIGLLVVTRHLSKEHLRALFQFAGTCIRSRLYFSIERHPTSLPLISFCYNQSIGTLPCHVDLRFLSSQWKVHRYRHCDVVLCDDSTLSLNNLSNVYQKYVSNKPEKIIHFAATSEDSSNLIKFSNDLVPVYDKVALGGTFDRLHIGHKVLLSSGCLLADKMLTVGVTTPQFIVKKLLSELIEPVSYRIDKVAEFVNDIKPELQYHLVQLTDPFGPPIHLSDYQALICSSETIPGCKKINELRKEKGYHSLKIHTIDYADDCTMDQLVGPMESKVSSSNQRVRLLGTLLRPPRRRHISNTPYIIGLTGGICSGKSTNVTSELVNSGAIVINCDKLGHQAYLKGSITFDKVVAFFGVGIVDPQTGEINRRLLGDIVFADEKQMSRLNEIVWPAILDLARKQIDDYYEQGYNIIVLDAAVLLEAEWYMLCHEVWLTVVPRDEAIKRLMSRNGWDEAKSMNAVDSQMSNIDRVQYTNVVFCTLWEPEVTRKQVQIAWNLLHQRLGDVSSPLASL